MFYRLAIMAPINAASGQLERELRDGVYEYLVRGRVDEARFERLVTHIRTFGYEGHFYTKRITYYDKAGLVYWTMGAPLNETTIINRCRKEDSFEYRSRSGKVP